jgi:hypothetical protein
MSRAVPVMEVWPSGFAMGRKNPPTRIQMWAMAWRTGCPITVAMGPAATELDDLYVDLVRIVQGG